MTQAINRKSGMAVVEFALLLPVLIVLVLGIIESGTFVYSMLTVHRAAQEGVRFAATGQGFDEGTRFALIEQTTNTVLESLKFGEKYVIISSWPTSTATGPGAEGNAGMPCQLVEVSVLYNYHPITPIVGAMLPDPLPISSAARKVNEPWLPCD